MNTRKAVAAAVGAALLGAGTTTVIGGSSAHGQLNTNKTGTATSSQTGVGGSSLSETDFSSGIVDASGTLTSAVGARQRNGHISQTVANKVHSGKVNGTTHGSARSGSQHFHIG